MATGRRLIDTNALEIPEYKETGDEFVDGFHQGKIDAILEVRALAPTVDAVEVVRCKDCRFSKCFVESGTRRCRSMNGLYRTVEDSDFCSYGEREDDGRPAV